MGLIPYKNEVYLDWTEEKNVEAMRAALKDVGSGWAGATPRSSAAGASRRTTR